MEQLCTIYKDLFAKEPHYITVEQALARIKNGRSIARIEEIRNAIDKDKAVSLKCKLPSVCFSGKFSERKDDCLIEHSGYIVLDFDDVDSIEELMPVLYEKPYIAAAWVSPRGNGVKALAKILDGSKHREHFNAIRDELPQIDKSGVNPSRVCFESYDPNLWIKPDAKPFTKVKTTEKIESKETVNDEKEIFSKLLKWLSNKNEAFVTGERNTFIFKLASACCRFGLSKEATESLIMADFPPSNDFTHSEEKNAIKSAYKSNNGKFGSVMFERDVLVDKITRKELTVEEATFDLSEKPRDVVYGFDVKGNALNIYRNGYEKVLGIGIPALDKYFKQKNGEVTCITGVANFGKSQFLKYMMLMRVILYDEKFATFSPEDNPPEEYYHDFVEMFLGCNCTPDNPNRPSEDVYSSVYDYISDHIFYTYPKDLIPSPQYIKEKFLELIIKEKVSACVIDPFNQLAHDYSRNGNHAQYLETILGDITRFAQRNNVPIYIINHPHNMTTDAAGDFNMPRLNNLNGGAMWGNKMDNVLVYHRPKGGSEPDNPLCSFTSLKIKRQKIVGKKGTFDFSFNRSTRRFEFDAYPNNNDPMQIAIDRMTGKTFRNIENFEPAPF